MKEEIMTGGIKRHMDRVGRGECCITVFIKGCLFI